MDYNKEYAKKVYAGLKKRGYTDADLGEEELFVTRMGREENRRYLYDLVTERGDANIGSWKRFNTRMTEQPTVELDGVIQYLENLSGIPYPQKEVDKSQYTFTGAELGIEPKPAITGKGVRDLDLSGVERPTFSEDIYKRGDIARHRDAQGVSFDKRLKSIREDQNKFMRMRYGDGGTLVAPGVYKEGDVYHTAGGTAKKLTNANYKAYKAQVESDITDMMALYEQIGATPYGRLNTSEWGNYVDAMELGSEGRSRGERRLQEWRNRAGEQTFFLEGKELPRERTIPKPKGYSAALRLLPLLSLPVEEGKKILGEEGYNALKFFKAQNERFAQFNNEAEEDAARLTPVETFYQSAESMGRGVEGFTGEALNLFSGSSLDDKFIIDNWDYYMELRKQVEKDPGSAIPEKDVDKFEYISELVKETGSIEAAKAEIKKRSEDVSVGDRLRMDASDAIDSFNPTAEGFGGFVAEMAPQMIGVIGSLIAGGAGAPVLAAGIGYANMGYLTASEMGHAMKEARDAGATNLEVWLTGIANGAVELITEKLPFDYLTRGILRTGKGKIAKELVEQMAENPAAREEMEELLIRAGKEMNEPLLSGRNIKKYVANVAAEGASEFTAESLQTMTTMIYENPEDYPTLTEILKNGVEGLKGGLFMGAVNAGIANPMERRANDERRKRQGYVQVARVEVDGNSYIGEILGEKESGELVVLVAGKEKTVTKDNIKDIVVFEYNDFHNGVLEGEINAAYEEAFNEEPSGAAASSSARGLNDAENAARVALGVANGVTIEEYMDGKTIEQVAMGDDSVREALENYFKAKADFDGRRQRFQEMLQKAYEASDKAIDAHINKRNPAMVYSTMYNGHQVYITNGDVVLNEDGTIDYNNSSELYITYPDGHVEQVSANKIIGKITAGNTEELKAQARAQIDQNWKNEFDAAEVQAVEQEKRDSGVVFDMTDLEGTHRVEIVGWRMVNEKGLAKMQRQAEREGGQFLILSPNDGSAAALSALPLGLSSESEDRNSVSNSQENTQKSGEIAENGGEVTETTTEQTENENLQTEATQESDQVVESPAENNNIHSRSGSGPLTDREVVMESDVYSKVLGKPRYYGQKQRNYVARQRAKMAQKATELAEKLNTPIEVRETAEGLTGKKAKAKGWYDVKSGNIVVVVSNHGSIEDIQATVLHEVVAHKGLRQMFGEHFDAFLDNVYNNVDAEIRAEIDALTEKYGNTREATEEYLASLAENTYFEKVNPSLWSRIKQWFLNMLTEAGIKLDFELSDNELRYILWRSHQRLVNPGIYNPITRITDVAVRARLGIGEYAPAVEEMAHVAEEDAAEYANKSQYRIADDVITTVEEFNSTHKGAAPTVIINSVETLKEQLSEKGFSDGEIERAKEYYKEGTAAVYFSGSDYVVINRHDVPKDELIGYLWHENGHRAFDRLYNDNQGLCLEMLKENYTKEEIELIKAELLEDYPDYWAEEAVMRLFERAMMDNSVLDENGYVTADKVPGMKGSLLNLFNNLISHIENGQRREGQIQTDERGALEGNAGEEALEMRNSEREERAAEETRFRITEQEIARNTATFLGEKLNTPVSVIEDSSTLPENRRDKKGWFDPKTGEVAVVMGNHISTEDVVETVLHEVVGHKGLRAVMGEKFDEFLDGVYKNGSPRVKRGITDVFYGAIKGGHALTVREATEEYVAGLAERDFEGFEDTWNAIKQWFRDFFRNFMNMEVTDGELRYMLWKNYNRMKSGPIETIIDRAMEARTDTGDKGTMFRRASTGGIGKRYDRRVEGKWNKVKEGWYDATRSMKVAQEEIERESGKSISDSANIYDYANHVPSINRNKMERFDVNYIQPFLKFLKAVRKIKLASGEKLNETVLGRYANAKHGIERNREMSVREALTEVVDGKPQFNKNAYEQYKIERDAIRKNGKKWLEQQNELDELAGKYGATIRDYSGLTAIFDPEQKLKYSDIRKAAVDMVLEVEGKIDSKKFWEHIKGINGYSLKENYESGLMSLEDYKNVSGMYEYYVPLRGHKDIMAEDVYDYVEEKKSNLNGVVITTHGRITEANDIFATMLNMANSAIVFGSKNRMKQHLLNLCLMNQTPLLTLKSAWYQKEGGKYVPKYPNITEGMTAEQINAEHERFEQEMAGLAEIGLAVRHRQGLNLEYNQKKDWEKNQHAVPVKRNGREYIIYVNGSPRLAQAVNGLLLEDDGNWFLNSIDRANRWRAKAVTGYSPSFVLRNLSRDMQSASVVYYAMHGATQMRKFDATAIKLIPQIHKLYKLYKKGALNEKNETHRYFKEFLENGGETGYTEMISIEEFQKKVKKYARGASIGDFGKKPFKAMADAAEFANRGVENVCRFAAYMTSRKAGMSILKSINDAKEVSVNFNRKGSGAYGQAGAKRLYMFLNPAIQAMVQRIELTKKYPKRMAKVWATEFAMGAAMPALWTLIYALCRGDEDEAWGNYYNKSNFSRRANITLPLGDGTINIPLAHESRTLYGLGEMLTSRMMGHTEYDNVGEELFNTLTQSLPLNPIEGWAPGDNIGETLKFNLYPDALKPFIEIEYNRDFAGNRIHNASDFNAHYPERERGKRGASSVFTFISELISGEYERNWVDDTFGEIITPSSLEHLAKSYLGGLYNLASELGKTAQWIAGDEEFAEFKNVPIINSFYSSLEKYEPKPTEERTRRDWEKAFRFYAEEISGDNGTEKNYRRHIKDGDEDATPGYNAMIERGETLRIDIFNDGKEVLKELYNELNAARAAKNLKAVEDIDKRIYAQKRKMVEQMEQMGDDPMSGYLMLRGKIEGIYGEYETYGDYWDMNVINNFQTELKPLYEEYKGKRVDSDKQKVKDLWWYLEDIEDDISYAKKRMTPENADEKMAKIRELRAKAIKRINNYRKDE